MSTNGRRSNNSSGTGGVMIRGVHHFFGDGDNRKQVLYDNSLTLLPGELVIMTGPSGSGKTTLLTLIGGLRAIQDGSIQIEGRELSGLDSVQLTDVRRNIGFIFQAHNLFESLTAHQNVRLSLELHDYSQAEKKQLANEMLTKLGLEHRMHYKPRQLSGGQRQRVAIARALVNRPRLVLADEPTAALDKDSGRMVITLLKELAAEEGSTILVVTHDSRIIDTADRIVNMVDGCIASESLVEETITICEFLVSSPLVRRDARDSQAGFSDGRRKEITLPNSPQLLTAMAEKMRRKHFQRDTFVVRQGDVGDKFYLIREGEVEVLVNSGHGDQVVAKLGAGQYFGESALIADAPRNASVRCLSDVAVYSLNKEAFLAVLEAASTFDNEIRGALFGRN